MVEQKHKGKEMIVYIMRQYPKESCKEQTRLGALYHLQRGEPQMVREFIVTMMDNDTYNQAKKEIMEEIISVERHSINAIGIIKQKQDEQDPLHIYKINDRKLNGKPSFVFKSSTPMARIALLMDQENKVKTPFQDAVAFMDGLHSRVVDYMTPTLWVCNPVIHHLQRIACMECESENTENITTFLTLVNQILRQVKGDPDYIWAPKCIMADENGANKNAIGKMFGKDLQKKTISCQWHYLRCARKQSQRIMDTNMKERFLELTKSMVKDAVTKNLYIQFYRELYTICQKFKTTKWLDFWHERRAHYVPGFRGYGYPHLNLAEPGQHTMRTKRMTLVDVAFEDILKQMHQDELHNEVDGIGCQSKTVIQIMVECEAEQKKRALLYIKTLQEFKQTGEKLWQENPPTHDPEDPSYFIPEESASHKFIDPDEAKKKSKSHQKRKVTQETIQKPKKKKRTDVGPATPATCTTPEGPETPAICATPEGLATPQTPAIQKGKVKGKSTPKRPSVITPNPNDYGPLVPDAIEKTLLQTEVPNIVMYNPRIQGCYYGKCCHKWDAMFMIPPDNNLFRMKTYREYTRKADGI